MPSFDFITNKDFRQSLEADHAEMLSCLEVGAWKSAQVAAGSIVEALLIDNLLVSPNPQRKQKNLLTLDLGTAIDISIEEKILTTRTADLCSVIRSYRNLIHPGRQIRLGEISPGKDSASIAQSLVEIIVSELAKIRRQQVGLTAEQIVSKVVRDSQALTILKHLIPEVSEGQRERLLLDLFPQAHSSYSDDDDDPFDTVKSRLAAAYRLTLESSSRPIRERVASEFVRILREEDGSVVSNYCAAFFTGADLAYVVDQAKPLVKGYILGKDSGPASAATLQLLDGIVSELKKEDAVTWVDILVRTVTSRLAKQGVKDTARNQLLSSQIFNTKEFDEAVIARLTIWRDHFLRQEVPDKGELISEILNELLPV